VNESRWTRVYMSLELHTYAFHANHKTPSLWVSFTHRQTPELQSRETTCLHAIAIRVPAPILHSVLRNTPRNRRHEQQIRGAADCPLPRRQQVADLRRGCDEEGARGDEGRDCQAAG